MASVVFWMEGNPEPLLIANSPSPETIVKSSLFLLDGGRYHPTAQVSTSHDHLSVTFSKETLPNQPAGGDVRVLLITEG